MILGSIRKVKFRGLTAKLTNPGVEVIVSGNTLEIRGDTKPFQDLNANKALGRHTFTLSNSDHPIICRCGISFKYPAHYSNHLLKAISRV